MAVLLYAGSALLGHMRLVCMFLQKKRNFSQSRLSRQTGHAKRAWSIHALLVLPSNTIGNQEPVAALPRRKASGFRVFPRGSVAAPADQTP